MFGAYGEFGESGVGDALADLNDAFGELDGFGETAKETAKLILPVAIGTVGTFATNAALDIIVTDAKSYASIDSYRWLISGAVGTAAGLAVWKWMGSSQGVAAIAAAILSAAVGYGAEKLMVWKAGELAPKSPATPGFRAYMTSNANPLYNSPNMGRYVVSKGSDLYQSPTFNGLGEGSMVNLAGLGEGSMVDLVPSRSSVLQGAINPGVFG